VRSLIQGSTEGTLAASPFQAAEQISMACSSLFQKAVGGVDDIQPQIDLAATAANVQDQILMVGPNVPQISPGPAWLTEGPTAFEHDFDSDKVD
jgi:hypothetical protein